MSNQCQHQNQDSIHRSPCSVLAGIWIMSYWNMEESLQTFLYQLGWVHEALHQKCPVLVQKEDVLLHNTRAHGAKQTQQKIRVLGWEVLPHLPYSPNVHLFLSLEYFISSRTFQKQKNLRSLSYISTGKIPDFFCSYWKWRMITFWQINLTCVHFHIISGKTNYSPNILIVQFTGWSSLTKGFKTIIK